MSTKLTKGRTLALIGHTDKKIRAIKNTICWRKPANAQTTRQKMSRHKHAIGVVSSCNLYRKPNAKVCKIWCHCYRDVKKYIPNSPAILLSESDFVDPKGLTVLNKPIKWDFYYFTADGSIGN